MRRAPYKGEKTHDTVHVLNPPVSFDPNEWANSEEAAIILRKFRKKDGKPSVGAIHTMIYRGKLAAHRFFGRLLFRRSELMRLVALSPTTGG
ncbi:hypothetical protein WDW37_07395 [Bdellovibrionota bacterium FG-1]